MVLTQPKLSTGIDLQIVNRTVKRRLDRLFTTSNLYYDKITKKREYQLVKNVVG